MSLPDGAAPPLPDGLAAPPAGLDAGVLTGEVVELGLVQPTMAPTRAATRIRRLIIPHLEDMPSLRARRVECP